MGTSQVFPTYSLYSTAQALKNLLNIIIIIIINILILLIFSELLHLFDETSNSTEKTLSRRLREHGELKGQFVNLNFVKPLKGHNTKMAQTGINFQKQKVNIRSYNKSVLTVI